MGTYAKNDKIRYQKQLSITNPGDMRCGTQKVRLALEKFSYLFLHMYKKIKLQSATDKNHIIINKA